MVPVSIAEASEVIAQLVNTLAAAASEYEWALPSCETSASTRQRPSNTVSANGLFALLEAGHPNAVRIHVAMMKRLRSLSRSVAAWPSQTSARSFHIMSNVNGLFAGLRACPSGAKLLSGVVRWIIRQQDKTSRGWRLTSTHSSLPARPIYTAHALNALLEYRSWGRLLDCLPKRDARLLDDSIRHGVASLLRSCIVSQRHAQRYIWSSESSPTERACLASTAMALYALSRVASESKRSDRSVSPEAIVNSLDSLCDALPRVYPRGPSAQLTMSLSGGATPLWSRIQEQDPQYAYDVYAPLVAVTLLGVARRHDPGRLGRVVSRLEAMVRWILDSVFVGRSGRLFASTGTDQSESYWATAHAVVVLNRWRRAKLDVVAASDVWPKAQDDISRNEPGFEDALRKALEASPAARSRLVATGVLDWAFHEPAVKARNSSQLHQKFCDHFSLSDDATSLLSDAGFPRAQVDLNQPAAEIWKQVLNLCEGTPRRLPLLLSAAAARKSHVQEFKIDAYL